jgi:hypothetical protein
MTFLDEALNGHIDNYYFWKSIFDIHPFKRIHAKNNQYSRYQMSKSSLAKYLIIR